MSPSIQQNQALSPEIKAFFQHLPGRFILVSTDDPKLPVVLVNDELLKEKNRKEEINGQPFFTVFPELAETKYTEKTITDFISQYLDRSTHSEPSSLQSADIKITAQPYTFQQQHYLLLSITENYNSESATLPPIEESFRLFEQAPVAICMVRGAEYFVDVANESMLQFLGRTKDIIGRPVTEALTEAEKQGLLAILDHVRTTGETYYTSSFPAELLINGIREQRYFDMIFKRYQQEEGYTGEPLVFCVAQNVTEQVLARKKVEESEVALKRFKYMADHAQDPFLLIQSDGGFAYVNEKARDAWGFSEEEISQLKVPDINPEFNTELFHEYFERTTKEVIPPFESINRTKDGRIYPVEVTLGGLAIGDQNFVFAISRDITERKKYEEASRLNEAELQQKVKERTAELESINQELKRSNGNLEEFAHAASHDLKEPIRKILFFTDRLKTQLQDRLKEEELFSFVRIEKASQRMSALIDDLLLYSHVSQRPHDMESVDLNEKMIKVLEDLELDIHQKEAIINISPLPVIRGYRRQLQQLLQNLVANALKYNRKGVRPVINIHSEKVTGKEAGFISGSEQHQTYHLIKVSDNGIGFDPEDEDRIFQMFQRLHGNTEYSGTGVGLSIARKVTDNHQGKIKAEGRPGEGASFFIYLPA
jgi:PAS domain S-box-containing protein